MQQTEYFEKDPLGMRAGIRIKNLRKVSFEILLYYVLFVSRTMGCLHSQKPRQRLIKKWLVYNYVE